MPQLCSISQIPYISSHLYFSHSFYHVRNATLMKFWTHLLWIMHETHGMGFLFEYLRLQVEACWLIKPCRFLAERGPLVLLDDEEETIGMEDIYEKIAGGNYGCSWDAFQAYKHLKLLGYIIGRYGVPWTMKNTSTCDITDSPTSMVGTYQSFNRTNGACNDITKLLKEMHIDGIYPSFEVYLPNSKFKGHPQESLVPPMPVKG